MLRIPENFVHTRSTPFWNKETATEPDLEVVIEAGSFGISPPQKWHRIELLTDDTYFNIDFFADPAVTLSGAGIGKVVNTHKE